MAIDMASTDQIVVSFRDAPGLESATDYLRDGLLPSDGIVYDRASSQLTLSFRQPDFTQSEYKRLWLCLWQRVTPLRCWTIIFRRVLAFDIDYCGEEGAPRDHWLANLYYRNGNIRVVTHDAMILTIHVERIDGEVVRHTELDSIRAMKPLVVRLWGTKQSQPK